MNCRAVFRGLRGAVLIGAAAVGLQAETGLVRSGGQPVPGATVTATQGATKVVVVTDQSGRYTLPPLAKGSWTIEVTMFGFEPARKQVTEPEASRQLDFNLSLQESEFAARLNRFAGARGQEGSQLESQMQSELNASQAPQPSPGAGGSNETFLLSGSLSQGLSAGAAPDFGPGQWRGGPPGQPGGGAESTGGANAPGFSGGGGGGPWGGGPRFGGPPGGRFHGRGPGPGGAQFGNRRPPNQIHGMVFGTLQNSALNARPFSITGQDIAQPAYANERLGALVGGPLVIPKIVKDESTFFFLSYFATRGKTPASFTQTVPTDLERIGNFSQLLPTIVLRDPSTGLPFPGNILTGISPIAQQLLKYFPPANQPGLVNNYVLQTSVPQNTDNFGVRVMRNITSKDRLAYHISYQRRDGNVAQPFGFVDTTGGSGLETDLAWTRTFSPTLVNTARVSFNRNLNHTTPFFAYGPDVAQELGILGTSGNPLDYGPPNLNFAASGFGSLSDGSPVLTRNQSGSGSESVMLVRGEHTFTFGGEYTRNDWSTTTDPNGRGTLNFTGQATGEIVDGRLAPGTGFDFADFLLGLPQSASIRYGESTYLRQNVWSGYAMDDWKVRPDLTLSLGVRYEFFAPLTDKYGRMANLAIAPGFTSASVVTPASPGVPAGLVKPDYNNFAPRLGLAWKVPKIRRSTVVRLGYGIYYNGQAYIGLARNLAQQPPFAVSASVNTTAADILTLAAAFQAAAVPGVVTNTYAVDPNYRTPYAQTWNATIEHDLGAGFFTEIGYMGTKGTRLDVLTTPNQGPSRSSTPSQVYTYDSSVGNSIYHALQVRVQRRFRRGISMYALYTFSKSIDDSSTFGGAGNTVAQNWLDLAAERGLSSFDRRHVLNLHWAITSPWGSDRSRIASSSFAGRLLKDWQLSGGLTAETGTPLTARVGSNGLGLAATNGVGSGRADATGQSIESATGFFNLAAFAVPPAGQFGNAGRNTIPGPGLVSLNLGLGRSFQLGDSRRRIELRLEANNALNHVNYSSFYTVVGAPNYGLAASAASMRTVTAVVRFRF
jgi:hypothetical protein